MPDPGTQLIEIDQAAALLRDGGLVAFPTETVYGLGANALDPRAVARIFAAKGRPSFDPLIVHVARREQLQDLVEEFPAEAERLAAAFWPGPLTLVLPKRAIVPDIVTSGLPTVGIRIPDHPVAARLLEACGLPIAAPSANRFGCISPTTAAHVLSQLAGEIDGVIDGGACGVGVESTVIAFDRDESHGELLPVLLRPGGLEVERIEDLLQRPVRIARLHDDPGRAQPSPGRSLKHYAPGTPLRIVDRPRPQPAKRIGLLAPSGGVDTEGFASVEVLSVTGDLVEAAAGFFAALVRLDAATLDAIQALPFPDHGLGKALNDRLRRAAHS